MWHVSAVPLEWAINPNFRLSADGLICDPPQDFNANQIPVEGHILHEILETW